MMFQSGFKLFASPYYCKKTATLSIYSVKNVMFFLCLANRPIGGLQPATILLLEVILLLEYRIALNYCS